ncbi:MAG: GGDEF domain-containing phosphodiesterase [Mycobacteriales bacterium]|nr:GGDEF domain-containing phosphodiesterase [Mycobacteriales bacterium]
MSTPTTTAELLLVAHRRASAAQDVRGVLDIMAEAGRLGLDAACVVLAVWEPLSRDVRCCVSSGAPAGTDAGLARAVAALSVSADGEGRLVRSGDDPLADQVLSSVGGSALLVLPLLDGRGDELGTLVAAVEDDGGRRTPRDPDVVQMHASALAEVVRALRGEHLQRRALYDAATGLPGPVLFEAAIADALSGSEGGEVTLLLVSVDQLQSVARSFGRVVADELARKVTARLLITAGAARWSVGRLPQGFGLLVQGAPGSAADAAARVVSALEQPWVVGRRSVRSTCRVGLATAPAGGTPALLLQHAEAALGEALRRPRGGLVAYGAGLTARAHEELLLETEMQAALGAGEFHVRYQPQVQVGTGRVVGAEALVRWQRESGMVTPARFIPAAEATGVIVDIDRWVLREALRQSRAWLDSGLAPLRMAVNISSRTLAAPGFRSWVVDAMAESRLDPDQVEVEVTESLELLEGEEAVVDLRALRELGVHVALDDFGTGYSNVGRLRSLPVDRVKIDQSFVQGIAEGGDGEALCSAVIGLARTLDLDVIAEGVETLQQLAVLEQRGCTEFQGYLKSPPVLPEAFALLVG